MVVKRLITDLSNAPSFESSVISYGSKTPNILHYHIIPFESSVISYGSKTI